MTNVCGVFLLILSFVSHPLQWHHDSFASCSKGDDAETMLLLTYWTFPPVPVLGGVSRICSILLLDVLKPYHTRPNLNKRSLPQCLLKTSNVSSGAIVQQSKIKRLSLLGIWNKNRIPWNTQHPGNVCVSPYGFGLPMFSVFVAVCTASVEFRLFNCSWFVGRCKQISPDKSKPTCNIQLVFTLTWKVNDFSVGSWCSTWHEVVCQL